MRKERNKRGVIARGVYTQMIIAQPKKKNGKPNPQYPSTRRITHKRQAN